MIDIQIPVLNRPQNAAIVAASIFANTEVEITLTFICTPGDWNEINACAATGETPYIVPWEAGNGDFARKHNWVYQLGKNPFVLLAADDLEFEPGWDTAALRTAERTCAGVIGINDDANPLVKKGRHATHPLVDRGYIDTVGGTFFDGPGIVYHEGYAHQYCNPPEAPILMADQTMRSLGEIQIGDEITGWDRPLGGTLNRLCRATVLDIMERDSPIVRVELESGRSFRCTPDHRWLNACFSPSATSTPQWITPSVGKQLLHVADVLAPLASDEQRLAGWLGGIFDGEGSGSPNPQIGQDRFYNPAVYQAICDALDYFGIPYTKADDRVWLTGGRRALRRFLHVAQPVKSQSAIDWIIGSARFGKRDRIVSVMPDGEGPVVSMSTTTGNYVAWGYASRNCDTELCTAAQQRREWAFSHGSVVRHLHPLYPKRGRPRTPMDDTYVKALGDAAADRDLYVRRLDQTARQRDPAAL